MKRARITAKPLIAAVALALLVVWVARWLRTLESIQQWMLRYPGIVPLPPSAPVGIPAWLNWQHGLNALLMLLLVKSVLLMAKKQRPPAFWSRKPRPVSPDSPAKNLRRISIFVWFHLAIDVLWLANGLVFVALLFGTGQWLRIVPTDWVIVPNALSAALQFASLQWPPEQPWVNYNSLQVLAYCCTVFFAAPIAFASGLRLSAFWPSSGRLASPRSEAIARALHQAGLKYLVVFVIVHVGLVFTTGARRNLNTMFAARDSDDWAGVIVCAAFLVVCVVVYRLCTLTVLKWLAARTGQVR